MGSYACYSSCRWRPTAISGASGGLADRGGAQAIDRGVSPVEGPGAWLHQASRTVHGNSHTPNFAGTRVERFPVLRACHYMVQGELGATPRLAWQMQGRRRLALTTHWSEAPCGGKLAVGGFEHFVGQRGAFDGARQGQGTDQGRHGGNRLAAPRRLGFAGNRFARDGLRQNVDQRCQTFGKGLAHDLAAARRVVAQRGKGAAPARVVAMFWRQVMFEQRRVGAVGRRFDQLGPVRCRPRHAAAAGLGDEILLGGEMAVEAAMGQIGRFHDVGNADAAKALGTKQGTGGVDDTLAMFGGFFPAYPHGAPQLCSGLDRLTNYMTIVINMQALDDGCHLNERRITEHPKSTIGTQPWCPPPSPPRSSAATSTTAGSSSPSPSSPPSSPPRR